MVDYNFLPKDPRELRANGEFNKVPMINGQCSEDGSLYALLRKYFVRSI